jgi:hypothetical protein
MYKEKPLVNNSYLLEKYPGKGGWTYVVLPEMLQDKSAPFGWVKVKGNIDDYPIKSYKLMPMGNGKLFLPVKAEIRKVIKKTAGDTVHIVLYLDDDPLEIPETFLVCLQDEPNAYQHFLGFTEGQKKEYVDWIYTAKTDTTKVKRIAIAVNRISKKLRFRDK